MSTLVYRLAVVSILFVIGVAVVMPTHLRPHTAYAVLFLATSIAYIAAIMDYHR